MPVTIHYNGKLDNRARLADLLDAARLYCAEQRWMYRDIEESIVGYVERVSAGDDGAEAGETIRVPIDDSVEGILITPHLKADPLWFTFNHAGYLVSYMPLNEPDEYWERASLLVDTQSAGVATHIAICEFLQHLRDNYMPGLNVYDETNYFESGDIVRAERAIDDSAANNPFDATPDMTETDDSNEPLAQPIESGPGSGEPTLKNKAFAGRNKSASKSKTSDKRSFPSNNNKN